VRRGKALQLFSSVGYFAIVYVMLFFYASDYFCSSSRGQTRPILAAKLAIVCTVWAVFAGACGAFASLAIRVRAPWIQTLVTAVIAGAGFASIPSLIDRGYGHFVAENTWADVSCFFTEGYGMMFPIVVAPLLTATAAIRVWLVAKAMRNGGVETSC
jgi:hypothetical protein